MNITAKDVIKVAEAELGYHEKKSNAQLDDKNANAGSANYQKYGRDLNKAGYYNGNKNGYEWCDQFVDWCFWMACGKDRERAEDIQCQTGKLGAGTLYSKNYFAAQNRFDRVPKVGDQVFFLYSGTGCDHTGLVVGVTEDQITTIEGNKNDQVQKCGYSRSYYAILGYGHPKYDEEEKKEEVKMIDIKAPQLETGSRGLAVKMLQYALFAKNKYYKQDGKKLTVAAIDGIFGNATKYSVILYQMSVGLEADGIVGVKTWAKLMEG